MREGSGELKERLARAIGRLGWLRLGVRRRLVTRLAQPERYRDSPFETAYRGGRYRGNKGDIQGWLTWFFGGYELKELALIDDVLRRVESPVVLDIGGNLGGHALSFARYAGEVHIFEPFVPLADRIAEQISLNGYSHLHLHRVGLSDREGTLPYFLDVTSQNLGTGSFLPGHNQSAVAAELDLVRGDDWLNSKVSKVDFIKIDIEGFEAPALAGLQEILRRDRPYIVVEVTPSSVRQFDARGGYQVVIPFEFQMWRITNPKYHLGLFQTDEYGLVSICTVKAEAVSYNVLIVPEGRDELSDLLPGLQA